jgi:iron(III) transport system substrate-binding protein
LAFATTPIACGTLGITNPPQAWADLADPRYFGNVGVTDPTKSGSVAKAFEMIIQQACRETVTAAGFIDDEIAGWEAAIAKARLPAGQLPDGVPVAYQEAVARGWCDGINRVRLIGANARYFTDSAGKVPIDVGMGATAVGIAIDFYGRFQSEYTRGADGEPRMRYLTPVGGSSVSADPISLLRGAPNRELAVRFITFCLGEEGQKLWNYRVGEPGGPHRYALRRLPIRRDFYPGEDPAFEAAALAHGAHAAMISPTPRSTPTNWRAPSSTGRAGRAPILVSSATWCVPCASIPVKNCALPGSTSRRMAAPNASPRPCRGC